MIQGAFNELFKPGLRKAFEVTYATNKLEVPPEAGGEVESYADESYLKSKQYYITGEELAIYQVVYIDGDGKVRAYKPK